MFYSLLNGVSKYFTFNKKQCPYSKQGVQKVLVADAKKGKDHTQLTTPLTSV